MILNNIFVDLFCTPMNFFYILVICLSNILTGKCLINIRKITLLKNDLWPVNKEKAKIYKKGYLYKVTIVFKCESFVDIGFDYYQRDCYSLGITEKRYIILNSRLSKDTTSFEEPHNHGKNFLKFLFLFTDNQIKNQYHFSEYKGKIQFYEAYKWLEKSSDDCNVIYLKHDVIKTCTLHIKDRFRRFVCMRLLKLNDNITKLGCDEFFNNLEDDKKFGLYYFKDYGECVESLKCFVGSINHFQLVEKKIFGSAFNNSNTLKISQFVNILNKKFNKDYKKNNSDPSRNKIRTFFADLFKRRNRVSDVDDPYQSSSLLFNKFCDHLKNEILSLNSLFPIGGKYDINFYIETFYDQIHELIEQNQGKFEIETHVESIIILRNMIQTFQCNLDVLQKTIIDDLCEIEYVHKHFPKLLGREIKTLEDYVIVESIVCDYYNLLVFISSLDSSFTSPYIPSCYYPPIFFDDYNFEIIDGIEIELEEQAEHVVIKAFDENEKESILVKNVHYFIIDSCRFYLTSDFLKSMDVIKIQILSNDLKIDEKFEINKYLKY